MSQRDITLRDAISTLAKLAGKQVPRGAMAMIEPSLILDYGFSQGGDPALDFHPNASMATLPRATIESLETQSKGWRDDLYQLIKTQKAGEQLLNRYISTVRGSLDTVGVKLLLRERDPQQSSKILQDQHAMNDSETYCIGLYCSKDRAKSVPESLQAFVTPDQDAKNDPFYKAVMKAIESKLPQSSSRGTVSGATTDMGTASALDGAIEELTTPESYPKSEGQTIHILAPDSAQVWWDMMLYLKETGPDSQIVCWPYNQSLSSKKDDDSTTMDGHVVVW